MVKCDSKRKAINWWRKFTTWMLLFTMGTSGISAEAAGAEAVEQGDGGNAIPATTFSLAPSARTTDFNQDWSFHVWLNKGANKSTYPNTDTTFAAPEFDDSSWRKLDLPHDWSIEQDFTSEVGVEYGALPTGIGWYRKDFTLPETYQSKRINVDFDGVFANSTIYVNGHKVGQYYYGYNSFSYDISDYVVCDGLTENVIAVKVDSPINGSRWYTGSGIYRDVHLTVTDTVHIAQYGTAIYTPDLADECDTESAVNINLDTAVENEGTESVRVSVRSTLLNYEDGTSFAGAEPTVSEPVEMAAGEKKTIQQIMAATAPALWSVDDPNLYKMKTEILVNGAPVDTYETRFGFKWAVFDADNGFSLNGEWMKLRGVCMHHDQGSLGAVANAAAIKRQMLMMKQMGANAIRVTHNPAAPELLRICDELGLMVVEESYDGWWSAKDKSGFASKFNSPCTHPDAQNGVTWGEYDFQQMIRKSRNSPCIIMWSLGNEVYEKGESAVKWVQKAANTLVPEADPAGHPLTLGDNQFKRNSYSATSDRTKMQDAVAVNGFNYSEEKYDALHQAESDWIMYGSETASAVSSRGMYAHPEITGRPSSGVDGAPQYVGEEQLSAFDNSSVKWGSTGTRAYIYDRDRKYIAGQFIWTGFDYIGEPSPFGSKGGSANSGPKSSYFGAVDTAGFPKDNYYLYQSQWLDVASRPMVHLLPHWNWEDDILRALVTYPSGEDQGKIPMRVYSNAPAVELFVNGESQGKKEFAQKTTNYGYVYQQQAENSENLYLEWPLNWQYETGAVIEAKAYDKSGSVIATDRVVTAGASAKLETSADRTVINADGYDLSYITVDVQDQNGNLVPTADNEISFRVSGNGKIVGVDNGNAASWERYKDYNGVWKRKAFSGKALVIVQSTQEEGSFTLTASAPGLQSDAAKVYTTAQLSEQDRVLGHEVETVFIDKGADPESLKLPETVNAVKADGSRTAVKVTWELPTKEQLALPAELVVKGLTETGVEVTLTIIVRGATGPKQVMVVTEIGIMPNLPETVLVVWSDGKAETKRVTWGKVSEKQLNQVGSFTVEGAVEDYPEMTAVAHIRVGEASAVNIALPANGGTVANASADSEDAALLINGGWDTQDAWHPSSTQASVEVHFDAAYQVGETKFYFWKKDYQVPKDVKIEYQISNDTVWHEVCNSVYDPDTFALYTPAKTTFDPVYTDRLRFTFSVERFDSGQSSIGVSEIEVYGGKVSTADTAKLTDLQVNGETISGFSSDLYGYLYTVDYGDPIPQVTATAVEGASCFVRQAVSLNGAANVEVTAESGTSATYTVQFNRRDAMLGNVTLSSIGTVREDDVIPITAEGTMQDGAKVPEGVASVYYTVTDGTGHAEVRNGRLYAYTAGTVTLTAQMTLQGRTVVSDPLEITIEEGTTEKHILSFEPLVVKTSPGTPPELPDRVTANYNTGLPREISVSWDSVDVTDYADVARFIVMGTVDGTALRPSVTVDVVGAIAAENISMGVVEGYTPALPGQTTVYMSDGTNEAVDVIWNDTPELAGDIAVYIGTVTCSGKELPVKANVRTTEGTKSENYALKFNGWGLPDGIASYTNDTDVNSGGKDKATYLNDGNKDFTLNDNKQVWTNYVPSVVDSLKTPRPSDWAGVVLAQSGKIIKRTVDTMSFGVLDEGQSYYSIKMPKDYYVEYYTGPIFDYDFTTDQIEHDGQVANAYNQTYWKDSPLNEESNWTEVEYVDESGQGIAKPVLTDKATNQMFTVNFKPVETNVIRIRMDAQDGFCLGLNEIETFGRTPHENSNVIGEKILIDGVDRTENFVEGKLTVMLDAGNELPSVEAAADNNAAVTVIPATALYPTATVRYVPEDGSEMDIRTYTIEFQMRDISKHEVIFETNGGSSVAAEEVSDGATVKKPTNPTRNGYLFAGWYMDESLTRAYDFAAAVTADLTLYAKWVETVQPPEDKDYTISFNTNGGTSIGSIKVKSGQTGVKPADPTRDGYTFNGWYTDRELTKAYDFSMPITADLTLYADWNRRSSGSSGGHSSKPSTPDKATTTGTTTTDGAKVTTVTDSKTGKVTQTIEGTDGIKTTVEIPKNGTPTAKIALPEGKTKAKVIIPVQNATAGTVAVLVKPDGTEEVIKTSVAENGELTVPVTGDCEIKIIDNSKSFADLSDAAWAKDAVAFVTARELFSGTSETTFAPKNSMTRGMLFTVLARLNGQDTAGGSAYYEKAMVWAKTEGISDGTNPMGNITREQLAVMLYRCAGGKEVSGATLEGFNDASKVSDWAQRAMLWATENGIITGKTADTLEPQGNATRAEVATMLMRFIPLTE